MVKANKKMTSFPFVICPLVHLTPRFHIKARDESMAPSHKNVHAPPTPIPKILIVQSRYPNTIILNITAIAVLSTLAIAPAAASVVSSQFMFII